MVQKALMGSAHGLKKPALGKDLPLADKAGKRNSNSINAENGCLQKVYKQSTCSGINSVNSLFGPQRAPVHGRDRFQNVERARRKRFLSDWHLAADGTRIGAKWLWQNNLPFQRTKR